MGENLQLKIPQVVVVEALNVFLALDVILTTIVKRRCVKNFIIFSWTGRVEGTDFISIFHMYSYTSQ